MDSVSFVVVVPTMPHRFSLYRGRRRRRTIAAGARAIACSCLLGLATVSGLIFSGSSRLKNFTRCVASGCHGGTGPGYGERGLSGVKARVGHSSVPAHGLLRMSTIEKPVKDRSQVAFNQKLETIFGNNRKARLDSGIKNVEGMKVTGGDNSVYKIHSNVLKTRLLTREEEYELGSMIQLLMGYEEAKDKLKVSLGRVPSDAEWAKACKIELRSFREQVVRYTKAKHAMIRSNVRMVKAIARRYRTLGVSEEDLFQEGTAGLVRAVEKYDPVRGCRFSTYASWWIQQAIFNAITAHSRQIRLPAHAHNLLMSIKKAEKDLKKCWGFNPTGEEVARYLDVKLERVEKYVAAAECTSTVSLEHSLASNADRTSRDDFTIQDVVETIGRGRLEDDADSLIVRQNLRNIVEDLTDDEKRIVSMRYGLDGGSMMTVSEVARVGCIPTQHVKKIELKAMNKLRSSHQLQLLLEDPSRKG